MGILAYLCSLFEPGEKTYVRMSNRVFGRDWSEISAEMQGETKRVRCRESFGRQLENRLFFGLKPGSFLAVSLIILSYLGVWTYNQIKPDGIYSGGGKMRAFSEIERIISATSTKFLLQP